jgi:glycosyltransferase involved in cell wall biosynthesis
MRIAYLASDPRMSIQAPTGYGSHIRNAIKAFESHGIKVIPLIGGDVHNISFHKSAYGKVRGSGVKSFRTIASFVRDLHEVFFDFNSLFLYKSILRREKIDFIYERAAPLHYTGLRLSRALGVPLVLEINDPVDETLTYYASPLKRYAAAVERWLIRSAAGIVVGSHSLAQHFVSRGLAVNNVRVIYPTADYDHFSSDHTAPPQPHGQSNTTFGFVGNMRPWHRADILIQAFSSMARTHPAVSLVLVGDGPQLQDLKAFALKLGIERRIEFTGSIPYRSVPSMLARMDVCVIPHATWYGSPTKLFEYGAMGKAVIGPLNTPVEEIIADHHDGLLFRLGDIGQLGRAMSFLAANSEVRVSLGKNLRHKLLHEITWDKNISDILSLAGQANAY